MEASTNSGDSLNRRGSRTRWTLRFAIAAVLGLAWWISGHHDKPEKLYEIKALNSFTDSSGKSYGWRADGPALEFYALDIATGKRTVIGRDNLVQKTMGYPVFFSDSGIFYFLQKPSSQPGGGGGGIGSGSPGNVVYLGTYLHSKDRRPLPGETSRMFAYKPPPRAPLPEWRWMPFTGGVPRTLSIDMLGTPLQGQNPVFDSKGVYWTHQERLKNYYCAAPLGPNKIGTWSELEPSSSLMYSPYDGSRPVPVVSGMSTSSLWRTKSYLLWKTLRVYPDRMNDVHCLRISDKKQRIIAAVPGENYQWAPKEIEGRIYWTEGETRQSKYSNADRLVSVAGDGVDRCVDLDAVKMGGHVGPVFDYKGSLYVVMVREKLVEKVTMTDGGVYGPGVSSYSLHLVKLKPGNPGKILAEMDLSKYKAQGVNCLAGDYLYFSQVEDATSWWDWLYPITTAKSISHMYRIHLPN